MDDALLRIYLNDHLAGATAGLDLAKRIARQNRRSPIGERVGRLAGAIEEDRATLRSLLRRVGGVENPLKSAAAQLAERAGRFKLNGRLLSYSPLSRLEELEALRLGVEGKLALWLALKETRARDPRLDGIDLDQLASRAASQRDELEEMRLAAAAEAFGTIPATRARRR